MPDCTKKHKLVTPGERIALAKKVGVPTSEIPTAVAISQAESGGNQFSMDCDSNGTVDYGLWQINSIHGYDANKLLNDPEYNAKAMFAISGGGKNWTPWVTFNSGAYKKAMSQIEATPAEIKSAENAVPGGGINIPGEIGKAASSLTNWATDLAKILKFLLSADAWKRILKIGGGSILLLIAVDELSKIGPGPSVNATGTAKKVAESAAIL